MNSYTLGIDCRQQDRRAKMPFVCLYQLGIKSGRRMGERRTNIKGPAYVDRYSVHLVLCTISILILSSLDAFFTLNILAKGGEEINLFMAILIEDSISKFIAVKMALTALALLLLTIHHNVQLTEHIRVRHLGYLILSGYTLLIGYELFLLHLASLH